MSGARGESARRLLRRARRRLWAGRVLARAVPAAWTMAGVGIAAGVWHVGVAAWAEGIAGALACLIALAALGVVVGTKRPSLDQAGREADRWLDSEGLLCAAADQLAVRRVRRPGAGELVLESADRAAAAWSPSLARRRAPLGQRRLYPPLAIVALAVFLHLLPGSRSAPHARVVGERDAAVETPGLPPVEAGGAQTPARRIADAARSPVAAAGEAEPRSPTPRTPAGDAPAPEPAPKGRLVAGTGSGGGTSPGGAPPAPGPAPPRATLPLAVESFEIPRADGSRAAAGVEPIAARPPLPGRDPRGTATRGAALHRPALAPELRHYVAAYLDAAAEPGR